MASEPVEPIDKEARRLLRAALEARTDLNKSGLARLVGVHRSTITRIFSGQGGATQTVLTKLSDVLQIPRERLRVQFELDFEIDDRFVELAKRAVGEELLRLREQVGRVRAHRITGSVGLRFHGVVPEEHVVERIFAVHAPRRAMGRGRRRGAPG